MARIFSKEQAVQWKGWAVSFHGSMNWRMALESRQVGEVGRAESPNEPATCAIITTTANQALASIHARMPVILDPEQEALWLDPSVEDRSALAAGLRPYPAEVMEASPVASLVSSVRNDGPDLIAPMVPTD